jgi:23S rRNA (pseudouridine1915-N3)-methyltransferase
MKMIIATLGRIKKNTPEAVWINDNNIRLLPMAKKLGISSITLKEMEADKNLSGAVLKKAEASLLEQAIPNQSFIIALDERGKSPNSKEFSDLIQQCLINNTSTLGFIIGGADGLDDSIRSKADYLISFGKMTWPHKLARVLLMEQLYRAVTILSGHPYHRE